MLNIFHLLLLLLLGSSLLLSFNSAVIIAFTAIDRRRPPLLRSNPPSAVFSYGKGSEIFPPGSDAPIDIRNSFPDGVVPFSSETDERTAATTQDEKDQPPVRWKRIAQSTGRTVTDKLLRRAARRSQQQDPAASSDAARGGPSATFVLLAVALVRYLQPLDFLLVIAATGYCIVLHKLAAQQRSADNVTPVLPALPPQGHVPVTVRNPLGFRLSQSRYYWRWLKLGEILGLAGPLVLLASTQLGSSGDVLVASPAATAPLIARPLFFLSCQAATESAVTRRVTTPLPIRILVPILYNGIRLVPLWHWALSSSSNLGAPSRWLAVANLAYATLNLWGFLIPVAALRYLRAHFFGVEAAQVVTRAGMEDSVGFM